MTEIQNKQFDELLQKCYNEYSHEGEFNIQGWNIIIFRKIGTAYADCGAFVSNETNKYFTGWFEEDLGNDIRHVMYSVVKYMFSHGMKVKINFSGDFDSEVFSIKQNVQDVILKECREAVQNINGNTDTLELNINFNNDSFAGQFIGNYDAWLATKNNNDFFSEITTSVCFNGELQFVDNNIKDFSEQAFNYKKVNFY